MTSPLIGLFETPSHALQLIEDRLVTSLITQRSLVQIQPMDQDRLDVAIDANWTWLQPTDPLRCSFSGRSVAFH